LKGYLLDTSVALLAASAPERLSPTVREALEHGPAFLSVVAYWEVMVKVIKGTLEVGDPRQWWNETLDALALAPLVCRPEHIAALYQLAPIHQDPFDRLLIAQASVEDLTFLTTDDIIPRYASEQFRVLG
jgi:PIN domain nuclease of toxin-antitoxin system